MSKGTQTAIPLHAFAKGTITHHVALKPLGIV